MSKISRLARHDHRGTLGRVPELVQIGGDGGHAGHAEIEEWHGIAELLGKRQEEPADTAVHVEADVSFRGERRELLDRVDHAERQAWRRGHQQDGVRTDRSPVGVLVDLLIGPEPDRDHPEAEVVGALGERRGGPQTHSTAVKSTTSSA